ncbi:uncharacterized protein LOC144627449 [Crassostrea virginica]
MAQKDWMTIKLERVSESYEVSLDVHFGLFVGDTKILLSVEKPPSLRVYDVTNSIACCKLEINGKVAIKKIETIELERQMTAISRGSSVIVAKSITEKMICDLNFSIKRSATCRGSSNPSFVSCSFKGNEQAFISNGKNLVIVDENNKEVQNCSLPSFYARGLTFDLQDNILVCMYSNRLVQIKHGGGESSFIDLPGIQKANNVVLHPTGEKVMVLGHEKKFCVYNVV